MEDEVGRSGEARCRDLCDCAWGKSPGRFRLGDALNGAVVALQADGYDEVTRQVWNVHVVGRVTAAFEGKFVISPGIIDGEWSPL